MEDTTRSKAKSFIVSKPKMIMNDRLKRKSSELIGQRVNRNRKNVSERASKLLANKAYDSAKPDFTLSFNKTPNEIIMNSKFYRSNIECLSGGRNSIDSESTRINPYIPKLSTIALKKAEAATSSHLTRYGKEGGAHDKKIKC